MLNWVLLFLAIALIAALFGFGGIATAAAGIAEIIFWVFAILFVISLITHIVRGAQAPRV